MSHPCARGGACHKVPSGFQCHCPAGWSGTTCAIDTDECESSPCAYSGTCMDLENDFECICSPPWSGKTCQIDVKSDPCSPNPCQNKAMCHSQSGDFTCTCSDVYQGKTCSELRDYCETNECQDYLVPVLVCVFRVLCLACIAVCVWWTRKKKKDRQEAGLAS
ncbi:unnamed protein product [Arctogadus glacialis]